MSANAGWTFRARFGITTSAIVFPRCFQHPEAVNIRWIAIDYYVPYWGLKRDFPTLEVGDFMITLSWSITSSLISVIAADFPPAIIVVFRVVGVSVRLTHLRSLLISLTS